MMALEGGFSRKGSVLESSVQATDENIRGDFWFLHPPQACRVYATRFLNRKYTQLLLF